MPGSAPAKSAVGKKAKSRKTADPSETEKLLAAKINQLELDAAGEKDQEQEIGKWEFLFHIHRECCSHRRLASLSRIA
jgi:hypothetical protein